jgi:hypothetical protein
LVTKFIKSVVAVSFLLISSATATIAETATWGKFYWNNNNKQTTYAVGGAVGAAATNCPALPYTLVNGQIADATQVMSDFNDLLNCSNNNLAPNTNPNFTGNLTISNAVGIGTNTILGNTSYQIGTNTFMTLVKGDLWFTVNAYYDGTNWQRVNTAITSYALNISVNNNIPNETMGGAVWWIAAPCANPIGAYTTACGWDLSIAQTAFKDFVVGGYGIEMDGNGTFPYGRLLNNNYSSEGQRFGIVSNLFDNLAGVDSNSSPSWYSGIFGDSFVVQRAPAGQTTAAGLSSLLIVDSSGLLHTLGVVVGGVAGASCTGAPTASFAVSNGIITHC